DVASIISHQFIKPLFDDGFINYADSIVTHLQDTNSVVITVDKLKHLASSKADLIDLLFTTWQNANQAIESCFKLIQTIKKQFDLNKDKNSLGLEYLYRFNEIFNELQTLNATYQHIDSIKTLHGLYKEL